MSILFGNAGLNMEVGRLKAENARLAAALAMCKLIGETHKPHAEGCDCLQCVPFERVIQHATEPSTVLRDLLAPTIESLGQFLKTHELDFYWKPRLREELARLRAITERKQ